MATEAQCLVSRIRDLSKDTSDNPKIISGLYAILTTLDAKASGLLRVNSTFIAVLTVFLGWLITKNPPPDVSAFWRVITYIDLGLFILSSFLCLCIVRVSWSFYGKAVLKEGSYRFDSELDPLAEAAISRSRSYQGAWYLTSIGLLGLAIIAVVVLSGVNS